MSAAIVQSDYEAMDTIARRFQYQNQQILALKQRVDRGVNALRSGGWQGEGSTAFVQEMERIVNPGTQRLIDALAEAQTVTLQVKMLMRQAEEEAASVFQGEGRGDGGLGAISPSGFVPMDNAMGREAGGATVPAVAPPTIADIPPRDRALLSDAAYKDGGELSPELKAKGWRVMDIGQTDTGYYGVAYVNDQTKEVVIAHRGTDPDMGDAIDASLLMMPAGTGSTIISEALGIDNPLREGLRILGINGDGSDIDDDIQIARGVAPDQFHESQEFVRSVMSQVQSGNYSDYKVSHTGHSLGAVLADLHAAQYGQQAVTFDNPGSKEILDNMNVLYDHENHLSYQSHANLINTTNTPTGYSIDISLKNRKDGITLIDQTIYDHSLERITNSTDPATGRFYDESNPIPH